MKKFKMNEAPVDEILSMHFNNMFITYGEQIVRGYIEQTLTRVPASQYLMERHVTNLYLTYNENVVIDCWNRLFKLTAKTQPLNRELSQAL